MFKILLLIIIIAVVVGFFFFTKTGKRIRLRASGTSDQIFEEDASTPSGAAAYYNTAIAKKEEEYRNVSNTYAKTLGTINDYEDQLLKLKKDDMQLNLNINSCIDKNDDNGAKVYLKKQQEITEKIGIIKDALTQMKKDVKLHEERKDKIFEELNELKSEKSTSLLKLEAAQDAESLKAPDVSSNEEDKMLEKVREAVKKKQKEATGNRIAYDNSASVQQDRLDKQMKNDEIERKLEQLKAAKKK
nr:MAG TPA: PspA/IM30 family [Caudoviricetes sp.]